jgi:hypothetical protein
MNERSNTCLAVNFFPKTMDYVRKPECPARKSGDEWPKRPLLFRRNGKRAMDRFSVIRPKIEFIVSSFLYLFAESIIHNVKGALFDFIINTCQVFTYETNRNELKTP